jgi:hypothetical protein
MAICRSLARSELPIDTVSLARYFIGKDLLDRTTLAHIISASKIIADRLEFLQGLEALVFDGDLKHAVRERTHSRAIFSSQAPSTASTLLWS